MFLDAFSDAQQKAMPQKQKEKENNTQSQDNIFGHG